jgi:DNA gyrase/topoisomerase IV subunit A
MGERTGINAIERRVLDVLDEIADGRFPSTHVKSAAVVGRLDATRGVPPVYGYDTICKLASPWLVHLRLVDFHGNHGGPDPYDAPANPRYTEVRLAPAGRLALASERGDAAKLPIGLVNGDLHYRGQAPPFAPDRVVAAVRHVAEDPRISDDELVDIVGSPAYPTGCDVTGDCRALAAGEDVELAFASRVDVENGPTGARFVITNPPPSSSIEEMGQALADRVNAAARMRERRPALARRLDVALADVRNESVGDDYRLVCDLVRDADVDACRREVLRTWPVTTTLSVRLARPLAVLVRAFADDPAQQRPALEQLLSAR